ncbi:hypothetical protein [Streptomyces sanglieri]|uniref:hypothetical protein n=1 Tax=Streptomyces sanglieri TaxID=193460 RepID=UPI0035246E22
MHAFNQHPDQPFRVRRERHDYGLLTDGPDMNITRHPPRLPMEDMSTMETLTALLHGYPKPWTDIDEEISSQGAVN